MWETATSWLVTTMSNLEVNTKKKLVRRPPSVGMVADWVKQAKKLPRVIKY